MRRASVSGWRGASVFVSLNLIVMLLVPQMALGVRDFRPQQVDSTEALRPVVRTSLRNSTSAPLSSLAATARRSAELKGADAAAEERGTLRVPKARGSDGGATSAVTVQDAPSPNLMPPFLSDFEGLGNDAGVLPPDTDGDVGPNHYMQFINLQFGIWDKDGNVLVPSTPGNALWDGLGGPCETHNDGDPIVLYDHLADRWIASQFAVLAPDGNHECIAVSETGDPTGAWHQYDFSFGEIFNDYPKFGVWPDAYYMSINQFDQDTFAFRGAGAVAFERDEMLLGNEARMVWFDLFGVNPAFASQLPSELDGPAPPEGAPNLFFELDDTSFGFDTDRLSAWEFHVDWSDPFNNSTFGIDGEPNFHLDTAAFDPAMCGFARDCIPQPGTSQGLDAISERLMFRLQYRNFDTHESLVVNHTVDVDSTDHAGVRWYEMRDAGSGWSINQQGTYAPDDDHRWMGSAAMDVSGNIAIGYSVSSAETFPSIRVAGRLASDPLGELSQGESELIAGTGSQTHPAARWGDYSALAVDETDGCTFWYTNEYLSTTSPADWQTRIGSFKYPSCTTGPTGEIAGTVTDVDSGAPIEGATVTAGAASTLTAADGTYSFLLPVGTYDMTATKYGYSTATADDVEVLEDTTTTQDFALELLPTVTVSGTVTDGSGHGWPLYALITIDGYPGDSIYTNPETGTYSVELVQSTPYTFNVSAVTGGYVEESREVMIPPDSATQDFSLSVDPANCVAPGYDFNVVGLLERFDAETLPDGWSVEDNLDNGQVWVFDDPADRGNLTGGDGGFAIVDSDFHGPDGEQDTSLVSPTIDLSTTTTPVIKFNSDYFDFAPTPEVADVDLSVDDGATWTNVWQTTVSRRGPRVEEIDISSAAGEPDVRVRFHYYDAAFSWWWQVDNVIVGEPECNLVPGGLLVGNVYDLVTGDALNDATVTSDDAPEDTTTTFATPEDPALDDGFYILFSSLTGLHDFTASKAQYGDDTETVDVVADGVVRQDFSLGSGHLVVTPAELEVTVPLGGGTDEVLTVTNDGTATASFEISERGGPFDILGQQGTRVLRRSGSFSPYRAADPDGPRAPGRGIQPGRPVPPPNAPPWTDIADYPTAIMDNTADTLDGLVYSVGGFDGGAVLSSAFVYDPSTDAWTEIAPMSFARGKPAAAFVDGLLYVAGGWDDSTGNPVENLEIYDPATDTWTEGTPPPTSYAAAVAVALDSQLYLIGGCGAAFCGSSDVFVYDPAGDSWSTAASYPEEVSWTHCGPIAGQIICGGGVTDAGELDSAYAYDPGTDSWSPLASLPETRWAGGYVAASGLLLVSGGVTDNFATVTNEGFAYDPATDTWSAIPNANNTVYRGASACGFYKIGGSSVGFSPIPNSEVLPGLDECGAPSDVTWLSEDPTSGTLDPAESIPVTVTFDASVPEVNQPGAYHAELRFSEDTPHVVPPVPVTMNVTPPATWGKLTGTVIGLERCDAPGDPLAGATVVIEGEGVELTTDGEGVYAWWLEQGDYTITVSRDGWVSQTREVTVTAAEITTEDFSLRLDAPCASVSPESFEVTLTVGETGGGTLTLGNEPAAAGYDFEIEETPFGLRPISGGNPISGPTADFSSPAPVGPASVRSGGLEASQRINPALPAGWFGGADHPEGAVRYAHAQCDGDPDHFYVFGGVDSTGSISTSSWRYNAVDNTWTELAPIPEGGEGPAAACEAGNIHLLGGDGTDRHFVYSIGFDSWSTAAALPRPVWGAAVAGWDSSIYMVGGDSDFNFGGTSDEVNVYDIPTDTWSDGTAMPVAAVTAGVAQAGRYLYLAGGWDDGSPAANVAATQRYDLATDTWTTGPALPDPVADGALAASSTALYVIGGDADGGSPFDASAGVVRLEVATWPAGAWAAIQPLPVALTANNAGFCTEALTGGEVWSVGGANLNSFGITGRTFFNSTGETCPTIREDVPWLTADPTSGTVGPDSSLDVELGFDATDLAPGIYEATLLITTTDPAALELRVPVTLTVEDVPTIVLFSVETDGTAGGVAVQQEDVLGYREDGVVYTYFDGTDVGLGTLAIDAFAKLDDGSLLLSFSAPGAVPGVPGTVDDSDVVMFEPTTLGDDTAGTFSLYFDGSDVGLTINAEDVDGLEVTASGELLVSTRGNFLVPHKVRGDENDLIRFTATSWGDVTAGSWAFHFDGSDVGIKGSGQNLDAIALEENGNLDISTAIKLVRGALTSEDEDVATFDPSHLGRRTEGVWLTPLKFDGSTVGLGLNDVVAVELP